MATTDDPEACMPCRGTGKLTSNLGGAPRTVTCPWCRGGGVRLTGVDAQASWLGKDAEQSRGEGDEGPPPDAAA
jgi:DnaJ-class molecular chaperone